MRYEIEEFVRNKGEAVAFLISRASTELTSNSTEGDAEVENQDDPLFQETLPFLVMLKYRNYEGIYSERVIEIKKVAPKATDFKFGGFCHNSRLFKTFLASRIIEISDLNTGEVFDDGLRFFRHHPFAAKFSTSVLPPVLNEMSKLKDEIYLLALLALSDNDFHPFEFDFIVNFVANAAEIILSEDEIIRNLPLCVPNTDAIVTAIESICNKPDSVREFYRALINVKDADGIEHANEVAFVQYILNKLKAAGKV